MSGGHVAEMVGLAEGLVMREVYGSGQYWGVREVLSLLGCQRFCLGRWYVRRSDDFRLRA
jgi:hypothetical protein